MRMHERHGKHRVEYLNNMCRKAGAGKPYTREDSVAAWCAREFLRRMGTEIAALPDRSPTRPILFECQAIVLDTVDCTS
jgi:hypothetical protein